MKMAFKLFLVISTTILILAVSSSASSFVSMKSMEPLSEPFALILIGGGLIGLAGFFRKMKSDMSSRS